MRLVLESGGGGLGGGGEAGRVQGSCRLGASAPALPPAGGMVGGGPV